HDHRAHVDPGEACRGGGLVVEGRMEVAVEGHLGGDARADQEGHREATGEREAERGEEVEQGGAGPEVEQRPRMGEVERRAAQHDVEDGELEAEEALRGRHGSVRVPHPALALKTRGGTAPDPLLHPSTNHTWLLGPGLLFFITSVNGELLTDW